MTPELCNLRGIVKTRLSPKRALHVLCVEREVDALAQRWNADRLSARKAALLHDITKELSEPAQLKLCAKYDIVTVIWERGKLLHAPTGAAVALHEFQATEEEALAVRWHTTGRAGMSKLEKIIYLADCVDGTRHYAGVDKLRALCYEDLDAALLFGLEYGIRRLLKKGRPVAPATLEARNFLLTQGEHIPSP